MKKSSHPKFLAEILDQNLIHIRTMPRAISVQNCASKDGPLFTSPPGGAGKCCIAPTVGTVCDMIGILVAAASFSTKDTSQVRTHTREKKSADQAQDLIKSEDKVMAAFRE